MRIALVIATCCAIALAACSSSQTSSSADTGPVRKPVVNGAVNTPPPAVSTPVPVIKAHVVAAAGRSDPFVVLFGPPDTSSARTPSKPVVSAFPKIPTLPGFEGPPTAGVRPPSVWDGVRVTGILQSGGYTAIIEANGKAYVAHAGDILGDRYRVLAIGPHSVMLAADHQQRAFTLGG